MLYQGHALALKPLLSAEENLRYHPSGMGVRDAQSVRQALAAVGLAGYEALHINQLSAGQQRRVGLARLWLSNEPLWLLDEPFTAIDVNGTALLENKILAHVAQGGSVIFTSHQPSRFGTDVRVLDLTHYAI
jgi:heme exporter protein A